MTQVQYMQTILQLSGHRKILQWFTPISITDRKCTSEEAVPVLPIIQNLENLIPHSKYSRKVYTLLQSKKKLVLGFRLEPVLLLVECECTAFVIKSQNPLGFMMCIEQKTAGIKNYKLCFLSTRQIKTRKGKW